jgi:hypothetical protein
VFEPDREAKVAAITPAAWQEYIKESKGKALVDARNRNDPLVNPARSPNYDIWCPGCKRECKVAGKGVWLTLKKEYVCTYGVCETCLDRGQAMSSSQYDDFTDEIADRLSARYPFLAKQENH